MTMPPLNSSARRRAGALLAVGALALALAAPSGAYALPTLHHGDRGRSVVRLQHALHIGADGVFGRGTVRAVRRFQRRHGLHADGVVGGATWRMLRRSIHRRHRISRRTGGRARVATRGRSVRLLQRRLGVAADGVYGPGTARAVKRFQRRHGLAADGVVGPATWRALGIGGRRPVLKRAHLRRHRHARRRAGIPGAVSRAIAAANRIAGSPYRFGGGHRSFADSGYDCSGSVSYVLHGAGRLGSPLDSSQLMSYGSPGRGRFITIYANPGHAYMVIRGRRYDTTGRSQTGSRWQPHGRSSAGYVVRHPPGL
jgi:peptidoglycan hydrolase-like protein with peptidoglycan-binding domain